MPRTKETPTTPVDMLLVRYTWTETGRMLTPKEARREVPGARAAAFPEGWFWIGATPASADRIRRNGLKAIGTVLTTWFPPQSKIVVDMAAEEPEGPRRTFGSHDGTTEQVVDGDAYQHGRTLAGMEHEFDDLEELQRVLAEREETLDHKMAVNRGGTDAIRDLIKKKQENS